MKIIKLNEDFNSTNKVYFATEFEFEGDSFYPSDEGVHVELNKDTLFDVLSGLRGKKYAYEAELVNYTIDNPLVINSDLLWWGGSNIAELLLCKLTGELYPAAFIEQDDINPNVAKIDITEDDREDLESIMDSDSFDAIMKFLRKKGYDSIQYMIWESTGHRDFAYILPNGLKLKNIKLIWSK